MNETTEGCQVVMFQVDTEKKKQNQVSSVLVKQLHVNLHKYF